MAPLCRAIAYILKLPKTDVYSGTFLELIKYNIFVRKSVKNKLVWDNLSFGKFTKERLCGNRNESVPTDEYVTLGFSSGANGKEPTYQCRRHKRHRLDP